MRNFTKFLVAAAAIGGFAAPAAAQYGYPQPVYPQQVPQPYPGQPGYGYGQQVYGQGYAQNPVGQIIDQLLGNRYNVNDRTAVSRCASAAMAQAAYQNRGYNQGYGYNQGHNGYNNGSALRVTAITDVQRRNNGLRVSGLMSSAYGAPYGNAYGYQNQNRGYGDVTFRCNVDYRGAVTNVRIGRNNGYRG